MVAPSGYVKKLHRIVPSDNSQKFGCRSSRGESHSVVGWLQVAASSVEREIIARPPLGASTSVENPISSQLRMVSGSSVSGVGGEACQ